MCSFTTDNIVGHYCRYKTRAIRRTSDKKIEVQYNIFQNRFHYYIIINIRLYIIIQYEIVLDCSNFVLKKLRERKTIYRY